jgi:SAM-dependent methyltransferase
VARERAFEVGAGSAIPAAAAAASRRWAEALAEWTIPPDILAAAPEPPFGFPPALFERSARAALDDGEPTPSRARALDALATAGSVLDVGAGGGAASLPLAPPAARIAAVDESGSMLDSFAAAAEGLGVTHAEIRGRWPDASWAAPDTDVVVCHHVVYNVPDLARFLAHLDRHARRRVVVELTARHPQSDLEALWRTIHGIERPHAPTYAEAVGVAAALGYDPHVERFSRPSLWVGAPREEQVAFARRRLCAGPEHDEQIRRHVAAHAGTARELVTLWWDARRRRRPPA